MLYIVGLFKTEIFRFHESIAICETFAIKMFTEKIYHQVLLTICENFSFENNPLAIMIVTLKIIYMHTYNYSTVTNLIATLSSK